MNALVGDPWDNELHDITSGDGVGWNVAEGSEGGGAWQGVRGA